MNPTYQISSADPVPGRAIFSHKTWRAAALIFKLAAVVLAIAAFLSSTFTGRVLFDFLVGVCVVLAIAAMMTAISNARHFGRDNVLRLAWFLIAPLGIVDCFLIASYALPGVGAGGHAPTQAMAERLATLILTGTALSGLSRIVLAYVLWRMIAVYRGIGFKLRLGTADYVAIVLLIGVAIVSVVYASSGMNNQLQSLAPIVPWMMRWFDVADWIRVVALSFCAVLGVMVWRYATDSGGGLVAKAWRSLLLYAAIYLGRLAFTGIFAHFAGNRAATQHPGPIGILLTAGILIITTGALPAAECMLFLGASYQHEACSTSVELDRDQLDALAAEPVES
jgi:hypothetical protein